MNILEKLATSIIWEFGDFKPHIYYNDKLDFLEYLEKDCSITSYHSPGSGIDILKENGTDEIVGLQIWGFSDLVSSEFLTMIKKHQESNPEE
jgi:hypothetical protein